MPIDKYMEQLKQDLSDLFAGRKQVINTWKRAEYWRDRLENCTDEDDTLKEMEKTWKSLSRDYEVVNRRDFSESGNPVLAFHAYLEHGFYPPPEILLVMRDAFKFYSASCGKCTLEHVFFGPTKQRAGNYAQRSNKEFARLVMQWEFQRLLGEGKSRVEAADFISEKVGGKPDTDSIVRMFRKVKPDKCGTDFSLLRFLADSKK